MNLGIVNFGKKWLVPAATALAIVGGSLATTSCNSPEVSVNVDDRKDVLYDLAIANANIAHMNIRAQEQLDSINYAQNPTKNNKQKYEESHLQRLNQEAEIQKLKQEKFIIQ